MQKATSWSRTTSLYSKAYLFGLLAVPIVLFLIPVGQVHDAPVICLFRNITDSECYGCGTSRALLALIHGNLSGALELNRASPVVAILLLLIWAKATRAAWIGMMAGR